MNQQRKTGWQLNGDTCPKCGKPTFFYRHEDEDGVLMIDAEKCDGCKWVAVFGDAALPADVPVSYRVIWV